MASMSDYLENQIVDHIFRTATFSKPANIYFALFTAAPSDSGGGTEVTGGSYARVAIVPRDENFNATQGGNTTATPSSGTGGLTDNAIEITFPTPSANWGTITHTGVFDNSSGGNLLFHGVLGTSKTVNDGDPAPKFAAGDFNVTLA